jgi:hypothetical protein
MMASCKSWLFFIFIFKRELTKELYFLVAFDLT